MLTRRAQVGAHGHGSLAPAYAGTNDGRDDRDETCGNFAISAYRQARLVAAEPPKK